MLMGLLFNACSPAYVTVRPTHLNIERPMRPSANHVWVDGNWIYSRQTRTYSKNSGYWVQPNRGKKYTQGQWKSNRKGSRWVQGRWK
jgi:hypothetical protein